MVLKDRGSRITCLNGIQKAKQMAIIGADGVKGVVEQVKLLQVPSGHEVLRPYQVQDRLKAENSGFTI